MIDLHCHILPALDDGARDLDDSLAMARQAEQDGIEIVCATPHIRADHAVQIEEIAPRVAALQRTLDEHRVRVAVVPGGELAQEQAERLSEAELRSVTLGSAGRWLLVEPASGPLDDGLQALVERLAKRGMGSVIAHPERHAGADFRERLQRLAARGCLIQWTAEFVAQATPGDLVFSLAREGLVHLLGSDAHSSHAGRPVRLGQGYARLAATCTAEQLAWTADSAPRAILRGHAVTARP